MFVIPGSPGSLCGGHPGLTRRDLLRVGGSALMGLTLADVLGLQKKASAGEANTGGPGFGKAKSVNLVYLQGGPSHLDLWDPKDNVPDKVKSVFKPINTKLSGVQFTELMPSPADPPTRSSSRRVMPSQVSLPAGPGITSMSKSSREYQDEHGAGCGQLKTL